MRRRRLRLLSLRERLRVGGGGRQPLGVPDRTGAYSTTIRFTEERYRWLHQVAGTTGQSKSELVDEGLELLAERMGYGARPV